MAAIEKNRLVIRGIRQNGEPIRPGDWAERLSALVATFGQDRRLRYTSLLHPQMVKGEKTLMVDGELAISAPDAYQQVMRFVVDNQLQTETRVA